MDWKIKDKIKSGFEKVVSVFRYKEERHAKGEFSKSVTGPHTLVHGGSRMDRRIAWCAAFNRRNGGIVTAKSPISIYFATHKGCKR